MKILKSEFLIYLILVLAALAYILNAALNLHMIYPDEQYQTIEIANVIVARIGWVTWEWIHHTRNWAAPGFYMPLLWSLKKIGIVGGAVPIYACRVLTAVAASVTLWRLNTLFKQSHFNFSARLISLLLMTTSSVLIALSSATFSDTLAFIFLWLLMPTCVTALAKKDLPLRSALVWGCLIGLLFCIRFPMIIWIVGTDICLLLFACNHEARWRNVFAFGIGNFVAIFMEGVLDYDTWGKFFISPIQYFKIIIIGHLSTAIGTMPWYQYFFDLGHYLTLTLILLLSAAIFLLITKSKRISFSIKENKQHYLVLLPAIIFFAVHNYIGHKEFRFIFPIIPAIFYSLALVLTHLQKLDEWIRTHLSLQIGGLLICLAFLSGWKQISNHLGKDNFYFNDMSDLSFTASQHGLLNHTQHRCLIFIGKAFVYTRGNMLYKFPVMPYQTLDPTVLLNYPLPDCPYAFVANNFIPLFNQHENGWALLQTNKLGDALYYKKSYL